MTWDDIIKTISSPEIKKQLQEYGIKHLRLFGSYARGEETEESDIDFLYDADYSKLLKVPRSLWTVYSYVDEYLWKKMDRIWVDYLDEHIAKYIHQDKKKIY